MHVLEAALIANAINAKKPLWVDSENVVPNPQRPFYMRVSVHVISALVALVAVVTFLEIASAGAPAQASVTLIASNGG